MHLDRSLELKSSSCILGGLQIFKLIVTVSGSVSVTKQRISVHYQDR